MLALILLYSNPVEFFEVTRNLNLKILLFISKYIPLISSIPA